MNKIISLIIPIFKYILPLLCVISFGKTFFLVTREKYEIILFGIMFILCFLLISFLTFNLSEKLRSSLKRILAINFQLPNNWTLMRKVRFGFHLAYFFVNSLAFFIVSYSAIHMINVTGAQRAQAELAQLLFVPFYLASLIILITTIILWLFKSKFSIKQKTKIEKKIIAINIMAPFIQTFITTFLFCL